MTNEQIRAVLHRMLLLLEAQEGELYHSSDDEWAAIQEGVDEVGRGEVVSAKEMDAFWKQQGL
ncbi:MAG TPA: hypothetical protein VGF60_11000 [Xanthobacteraceae bacterium]